VVDGAQFDRVDAEEAAHVVVAHVVEIPPGAEIAGGPRLPGGMVGPHGRPTGQRAGRRHVGEGEALGGKADLGTTRVLQRPQVGAHAVIGGRPG